MSSTNSYINKNIVKSLAVSPSLQNNHHHPSLPGHGRVSQRGHVTLQPLHSPPSKYPVKSWTPPASSNTPCALLHTVETWRIAHSSAGGYADEFRTCSDCSVVFVRCLVDGLLIRFLRSSFWCCCILMSCGCCLLEVRHGWGHANCGYTCVFLRFWFLEVSWSFL